MSKMAYRITLECGDSSCLKKKIENNPNPNDPPYTHDWEVFVRGADNAAIHHYVEKVVFNLHHTFPKPKRVIKEPPYCVKESGYAGFDFTIEVFLKNKLEPKKFQIVYNLHLGTAGTAVNHIIHHSEVIHNPTDEFRKKLLKGGATPISISEVSEKSEVKTMAMVSKPKLSGSHESKKNKVSEPKVSDPFNDLFGTPITKMPKPENKKIPESKSSNSKSVPTPEKSEKSTKSKHSPHKDGKREKSSEEKKQKKDKERDTSKDKEKIKDKSKRSSSPSSYKVNHPSSETKRSSSPSTSKVVPTPPVSKKSSSPLQPSSKSKESKKSSSLDKDKDKSKEIDKEKDKTKDKDKDKEKDKEKDVDKDKEKEKEKVKENSKSNVEEIKNEKESKSERKKEKKKHKEDRDKEKKEKHKEKDKERRSDKGESSKSSEKKIEKTDKVEKDREKSHEPKLPSEDRKSPKPVKEEKIIKPEKPEKVEKTEKHGESKSDKSEKSKHKHKKRDKKDKRGSSRERSKKEKREKNKSTSDKQVENANRPSSVPSTSARLPESLIDRDSSVSPTTEDENLIETRPVSPKKEPPSPPSPPPAETSKGMSPPPPPRNDRRDKDHKRDRMKNGREEKKKKKKSEFKNLENEVSVKKIKPEREPSISPPQPVTSSQSPIGAVGPEPSNNLRKGKKSPGYRASEESANEVEQVAPDSTYEGPTDRNYARIRELEDLHRRIGLIEEDDDVQSIADIIEEDGNWYIDHETQTMDWNLCDLKPGTVQKIQILLDKIGIV